MKAIFAIVVVMLNGALFADADKPEIVSKIGLKETAVEGATIYYEACFESKLETLKTVYHDYRVQMTEGEKPEAPDQGDSLALAKTAIIDDICEIAGVEDAEVREKLDSIADQLMISEMRFAPPLCGENNTIFLMLQSTTKDYLRGGGTLPNLKYNKETDSATYHFPFNNREDSASNRELLLPVPSADEMESVLNTLFSTLAEQFSQMPGLVGTMGIHEAAEVAIIGRLRTGDPHRRWFTDGFANVLAYEILRRHCSQEEAIDFIKQYSTKPYEDIKNTLDLQYWLSTRFAFRGDWLTEKESDHRYARYCFATEEAKRIVARHGMDCIKEILDAYAANGNKEPGAIFTAVQQATGEDVRKRMRDYQTYDTKEAGIVGYQQAVATAMEEQDPEAVFFPLLRLIDLEGENPFSQTSLNLRIQVGQLLYLTGQKDEAKKSITDFADMMCESENPENDYAGRHLVIIYALKLGQPEIALEYARQTLENQPDDAHALTIVMQVAVTEKDFEKAHEIARHICKVEPNPEDMCHKTAQEILQRNDTSD